MNTTKMGLFLKELRKESGLTQQQLGDKIGADHKTISRWENGTYAPPVECLEILSDIYQVSINDLVAGERISDKDLAKTADDNLREALKLSEQTYKKTEKNLYGLLISSALLTIMIIVLLLKEQLGIIQSIILIILVIVLALSGNISNLVALVLNSERIKTKKS